MRTSLPRTLIVFALLGGIVALVVTWSGSLLAGVVAGLATTVLCTAAIAWGLRTAERGPTDADRRRFLALAGLGGLAWAAGGAAIGRVLSKIGRPEGRPIQEAMAHDLGAEYMELLMRTYRPGRSGDLQLLLAPFNSSNYSQESLSLAPKDPRTSHASVWMYLERVPLVVYGPEIVARGDSDERVTLADIAPTIASLIGSERWPEDRDGRALPLRTTGKRPKVVVTFVIDGGGWNALTQWRGRWTVLEGLLPKGMSFRNAIQGSFPAVTACAHATIGTGTFPRGHGITGHNIRDGASVRKAYGTPGQADPSDLVVPTLADLWSAETGNRAWVGEIGYQIWHLGMLGYGRARDVSERPVAVFWNEDGGGGWAPQHPELYRLPNLAPGLDVYQAHLDAFQAPDWDPQFRPVGRQAQCCAPPIAQYQGDLIEATFESEPIGRSGTTDLLFINFKTPDYTGHIYNMLSNWEGLMIEAVDQELARVIGLLDRRFPGEYVLIVTADHGQCPLPDAVDGVRLDPIQLGDAIESEFGGLFDVVQDVVPSEVYLHVDKLKDAGATVEDVAAFLRDYTYRENIGPYVARNAIEQDLLDRKEFAAVFATTFLDSLSDTDLSVFGNTVYTGPDVDPGIPPPAR